MNDCSKFDCKRMGLAIIVSAVFLWLFGWLYHGKCLAHWYAETPTMWRTMEDMKNYCFYILLGHLSMAALLGMIFVKGYEGKGIKEGVRFGTWMGLLLGVPHNLITFGVAPYPGMLAFYWAVGVLVQTIGVGVLMSLIYKNKA